MRLISAIPAAACAVLMLLGSPAAAGEPAGDVNELFPPELVSFVPSDENPLFTGTGADTWDRMIRERG